MALVASAAKSLISGVCKTKLLAMICATSAILAYYHNTAWLFPVLLVGACTRAPNSLCQSVCFCTQRPHPGGGLITFLASLAPDSSDTEQHADEQVVEKYGFRPLMGALLIVLWAALLFGATIAARAVPYKKSPPLHWFELFYRTGSLIFGGGQVVLPLLLGEMVHEDCSDPTKGCVPLASSWLTKEEFYTGLAAAQAMPGPLFNFAAYLGTQCCVCLGECATVLATGAIVAQHTGYNSFLGIALCWLGLFGPGILLIFGVLPFWSKFRHWQLYRKCVYVCTGTCIVVLTMVRHRALPGLNSAAVGLIASAVIGMVFSVTGSSSPFPKASVCIGAF